MQTTNLTNPGQMPIDGDLILITHDNGATEQYTYYAPAAPELAPQTYLHIDYPATAQVNTDITLSVSIKFANGDLAPVDATYYVPIIRDADGLQEAFKAVDFVNGAATVTFQVASPGIYIMRTDKIKPSPTSTIVDSPEIIVL